MYKSRADWLKDRKNYVCASDVPIIFGKSPWKTVMELYEDKLSDVIDEGSNYTTELGNDCEPMIRALFEIMTGKSFPVAICKNGIFMASLDGRTPDKKELFEAKCAGKETYDMAANGIVDPKYMLQIQTQLMCSEGSEVAHYNVYPLAEFKKNRKVHLEFLKHIEVKPDKDMQAKIFEEGQKFWNCVQKKIPPIPSDKDFAPLIGYAQIADRWKKLKEKSEKISQDLEAARDELIAAAEATGRSRLLCAGIKMSKIARAGSINYKLIPELKNVDLEQYRGNGSVSWKLEEM